MHFDDLDLDGVLANFAKISKEQGLDKKASWTLPPDQILGEQSTPELSFHDDLYKMANDELERADFEESPVEKDFKYHFNDVKEDMAKSIAKFFEEKFGAGAMDMYLEKGKTICMNALKREFGSYISELNSSDAGGTDAELTLAIAEHELSSLVHELLGGEGFFHPMAMKKEQNIKTAKEEFADSDLLNEAHPGGSQKLEGVEASDELAVVEDLKGNQKKMLDMARKEVKIAEIVNQLSALATELDESDLSAFADKVDQIAKFAADGGEEDPSRHPQFHQGMQMVQKKLNNVLRLMGTNYSVPETGLQGDDLTWNFIKDSPNSGRGEYDWQGFGWQAGKDFSSYDQLLALLDAEELKLEQGVREDNSGNLEPIERTPEWDK